MSNWAVYDRGSFDTYLGFRASPMPGDAMSIIDGGAGNDVIRSGTGNDVAHGGADNDNIMGLDGNDTLYGDDGDDQIWGDGDPNPQFSNYVALENHGIDVLDGGMGNDELVGQGQGDFLYGGAGNDKLWGDENTIYGTPLSAHGNDYLDGGAGDDYLEGGGRDDELFGGADNDQLWGDGNASVVDGAYHGKDYLDNNFETKSIRVTKDNAQAANDALWRMTV